MITCQICSKQYRIITNQHLSKHNINTDQYIERFPNAKLVSEELIKKHSESTKRHFKTLSDEQKSARYSSRVYSPEAKEKIRLALISGKHKINYNDPKRTEAISNAKKEWWSNKTVEERSDFFKYIVIPKSIERMGYDQFVRKCRLSGLKGYNSIISKGEKKERNGFEDYMLSIISQKGYSYVEQFEIEGWFYDCFIPEKNLIIEFDGDYWHAAKEEGCTSKRLKHQWEIDRNKDNLAIRKGYNIIRIRESNKDSLKDMI
jgi:very-short-patch-repair endonuclease